MTNIILASASPRRKEILSNADYKFEIIPSNYDEKICGLNYSDGLLKNCSLQKALDVKQRVKNNNIIVSADTVVVLNNKILGKPKDYDEAVLMLENLSNKEHFVATSITLIYNEKVLSDVEKTKVVFRKLTKEDIENYLENKKPFDKAGSYGIQDEGFDFVLRIDGELDNVIGFPLKLFEKMFKSI